MKRPPSVWLLAAPLLAASSVIAHALAYRLTGRNDGVVPDDTHGYLAHLPVLAAPAAAVAAVALTLRGVRTRRGERVRPLPWTPFALAPPLGLALQEHLEHLVHTGSLSSATAMEPTFAIGLALAVPLGLAASVAARALLASADRVALVPSLPLAWVWPAPALGVSAVSTVRPAATLAVARPTGRGPPRPRAS